MYPWQQPRPVPQTFLYLRTRLAVNLATPALRALSNELRHFALPPPEEDRAELLLPYHNDGTWENGLVLGLYTAAHPSDLADALKSALDEFDAWQIRNAHGEWAEWIGEGPLSAYYKGKQEPTPTAQTFLGLVIRKPFQKKLWLSSALCMEANSVCRFYIFVMAGFCFSKQMSPRDLFRVVCVARSAALIIRAAAMLRETPFLTTIRRFGSLSLWHGWSLGPRTMTIIADTANPNTWASVIGVASGPDRDKSRYMSPTCGDVGAGLSASSAPPYAYRQF